MKNHHLLLFSLFFFGLSAALPNDASDSLGALFPRQSLSALEPRTAPPTIASIDLYLQYPSSPSVGRFRAHYAVHLDPPLADAGTADDSSHEFADALHGHIRDATAQDVGQEVADSVKGMLLQWPSYRGAGNAYEASGWAARGIIDVDIDNREAAWAFRHALVSYMQSRAGPNPVNLHTTRTDFNLMFPRGVPTDRLPGLTAPGVRRLEIVVRTSKM